MSTGYQRTSAVLAFVLISSFGGLIGCAGTPTASVAGGDGIYFSAGGKFLYGTHESGDGTTIESRNLAVYGAETVLGYEYSGFILGVGAEYQLWKQLKNPDDLSGSNTGGDQTLIQGALGYHTGDWILLGKYDFSGTYKMSEKDTAGNTVEYSEPDASFALQVLYKVGERGHVGIEYSKVEYTKSKSNSTTVDLTSNAALNASGVGVVYAWIF